MDSHGKTSTALFDVYLRLRPPIAQATDRFLTVEDGNGSATHITINPPPDDYRRRAIERYHFTKIFEESSTQLDVFDGTNILPLIDAVIGSHEKPGQDGLLATLGVTGSGKSHTILGSRSQRGLTQMTLDVLFRSIGTRMVPSNTILAQLVATDVSESQLSTAGDFLDSIYGDGDSRVTSRAQTPLPVSINTPNSGRTTSRWASYKSLLGLSAGGSPTRGNEDAQVRTIRPVTGIARFTRSVAKTQNADVKEFAPSIIYPSLPKTIPSSKRNVPNLSTLPRAPNLDGRLSTVDETAEYAVVLSMYEVYNNRICDLLTSLYSATRTPIRDTWKPALLFKSTEYSPDRKVVAGLRKVVCGSLNEALLVLETGLSERTVAGTGSNAVSSRSHGFFCIEVKKRRNSSMSSWTGSTLTIVDLAGSERARTANTAGATLVEAGKINQSLMLLGQCMQAQSGISNADPSLSKLAIRQCKLTELLFSNSFHHPPSSLTLQPRPQQQKAIMIVTADPCGDYNATSQILKYSALAKETTVPRIPSITSTLFSGNTTTATPFPSSRTHCPPTSSWESSQEIARLMAELQVLREQLGEQTAARREMEASWALAEERLESIEAEVREECWSAFEGRLELERERWTAAWEEERERNDGHLDSKLEVLMKGMGLDERVEGEGAEVKEEVKARVESLKEVERENEVLKARITVLEREKMGRTPSRKMKVLKARPWNVEEAENLSP